MSILSFFFFISLQELHCNKYCVLLVAIQLRRSYLDRSERLHWKQGIYTIFPMCFFSFVPSVIFVLYMNFCGLVKSTTVSLFSKLLALLFFYFGQSVRIFLFLFRQFFSMIFAQMIRCIFLLFLTIDAKMKHERRSPWPLTNICTITLIMEAILIGFLTNASNIQLDWITIRAFSFIYFVYFLVISSLYRILFEWCCDYRIWIIFLDASFKQQIISEEEIIINVILPVANPPKL